MKRLRGVHVPHNKNTTQSRPSKLAIPKKVVIPMAQHIGAPCTPCVKAGDEVSVGQLIGEAGGFVSAPIHASVSGKVTSVEDFMLSNGAVCKAVVIEADGKQTISGDVVLPKVSDHASFVQAVRNSGLVGLGGAGFPTSVKLAPKDIGAIDTLIINAAECEPYITSDLRTMMDEGEKVVAGINYVKKYLDVKKVMIGIEDNKPEAVAHMKELCQRETGIEIVSLPSIYPQGGEKVLIYHITGRIVPQGKLPSDVGCVVMNVTSIAFLAKYMETGMPLVEKCITIDGSAVANPQNVIVPIGTAIGEIFEFCGGFKQEPKKVLMGGPMMGIAVPSLEVPLLKNNNAVLAFAQKEAALPKTTACIRCGSCIDSCPMNLDPAALERAYKAKNVQQLVNLKIDLCMECGCCAFVCPAKRDLVLSNKLAKVLVKEKAVKK